MRLRDSDIQGKQHIRASKCLKHFAQEKQPAFHR